MRIACIVEGHGEVESVRELVRRLACEAQRFDVKVLRPIRIPKTKLVQSEGIERAVELAARKLAQEGGVPDGAVVVVLDADDDPACRLGPALRERMRNARPDVRAVLVLAVREIEGRFLAALESLRGKRDIREDAVAPPDPESIRGAKERLESAMGRPYDETTDQPALAAEFDLEVAAMRLRSFRIRKPRRDLGALFSDAR